MAADPEPLHLSLAEEGRGVACTPSSDPELSPAPPSRDTRETHTADRNQPKSNRNNSEECVVCLGELNDDSSEKPTKTLPCNHTFHQECIDEWIKKDGRCPVCRHVVDQVAAANAQANNRNIDLIGPITPGDFTTVGMLRILGESRRLMMLATMQAALSVFVMSHDNDLISPAFMLFSASLLFTASAHFLLKSLALCRPLLVFNIAYHVWMTLKLIDLPTDRDFFSDRNTEVRADVLTFCIVLVLECFALKQLDIFYAALRCLSQLQIDSLRRLRRAQQSWLHLFFIRLMFIFICLPVFARYLCFFNALHGDVCEKGLSGYAPGGYNSTSYNYTPSFFYYMEYDPD